MGLGGFTGNGSVIAPTSITLVQTDPLPNLPAAAQAGARLAAIAKAVTLVSSPIDFPQKWRSDIATTQTHSKSVQITRHPVESGFQIADNAIRLPDVISFSGIVSDTPLTLLPNTTVFFSRALQAKAKIDAWFNNRDPLYLASSLGVAPSVVITKLDITRDENSGAAIQFDMTLEQVVIGSQALASAIADDAALNLGAGPGTNAGTLSLS